MKNPNREHLYTMSVYDEHEVWPLSVGTFPTCQNCIYSYEDGSQCRYYPTDPNARDENGDEYEFGNWRNIDGNLGDHCGQGVYVVGEMGQRRLVTFIEWYRMSLADENYKWSKKNA